MMNFHRVFVEDLKNFVRTATEMAVLWGQIVVSAVAAPNAMRGGWVEFLDKTNSSFSFHSVPRVQLLWKGPVSFQKKK